MKILVTGAKGFLGKNLTTNLRNIKEGKNQARSFQIEEIYEYNRGTDPELLRFYCKQADFVFNLAGVNRPKDNSEFMQGNFGFAKILLDLLSACQNTCPVMLSSSVQACLCGRYLGSAYGKSKKEAEELFFRYAEETGAKVLVYRFPNVFGKWCRPNYNSAVATFCDNIARGLPIRIDDRGTRLELVYIDDLVEEMFAALEGKEHRCRFEGTQSKEEPEGKYCYVPLSYHVTLGEIADLLQEFKRHSETLLIPEMPTQSFEKKLYATYLSYLPKEKVCFPLKMRGDSRGSFTELIRTINCGQFSVNISGPGVTKGEHWHNTKWELFIVVYGHGLIRERKIGANEVMEFEVSGDKIEAVHMLPGYTHSLINLSDRDKLITLMWSNEPFDPQRPDTFYERVEERKAKTEEDKDKNQ